MTLNELLARRYYYLNGARSASTRKRRLMANAPGAFALTSQQRLSAAVSHAVQREIAFDQKAARCLSSMRVMVAAGKASV